MKNPVAKHMHSVNRAATYVDRKKEVVPEIDEIPVVLNAEVREQLRKLAFEYDVGVMSRAEFKDFVTYARHHEILKYHDQSALSEAWNTKYDE
jgi:hypothetical protein